MVLAQRVEGDALDDDHLAVADVEDGAVDQPVRVDEVAAGQLEPHAVHPLGRAQQPLALRVLADLDQDLAHGLLDAVPLADRLRRRRLAGESAGAISAASAVEVVATLDRIGHPADVGLEVERSRSGG